MHTNFVADHCVCALICVYFGAGTIGIYFLSSRKIAWWTCHILDPIIKGKMSFYYVSDVEMGSVWFVSWFSCTRFFVVCLREVVLLFVSWENLGSCVESELPTLFRRNGRLSGIMNERKYCGFMLCVAYCSEFVSYTALFVCFCFLFSLPVRTASMWEL